jgi:hypothetical protein
MIECLRDAIRSQGEQLSPEPYRPALVHTAVQVAIHAFLWIVVLAVIILLVPGFQERFADLKFKVPWVTVLILDISNWFLEFWFFSAPLIVILLLAVDGPISFYLRLRFPSKCWLWSGVMILLPLAVLGLTLFALSLPWFKAREGAAKESAISPLPPQDQNSKSHPLRH